MPRQKFNTSAKVVDPSTTESISSLVDNYINLKEEEKKVTTQLEPLKTNIKAYFKEHDKISSVEGETGAVSISFRKKNIFAENEMIEKLGEKLKTLGILKVKEYIDYDVLESALYENRISGEEIAPYRKVKITPVLNVKRR